MEKKEFVKALKLIAICQKYKTLAQWEELIGSS